MLRVLVVDDRVDFRQAFCALLDGQPDLEVVGQVGSLAEARTMVEGVDVALLDRGLPDGDGLKLMGPSGGERRRQGIGDDRGDAPSYGCDRGRS